MSANQKYASVHDVGSVSDVNCRRKMEDQHTIIDAFLNSPNIGFFAVYDGHGGTEASDYAAKHFHRILSDEIRPLINEPFDVEAIKNSFINTYQKLDDEMINKIPEMSGCCAVTSLVFKNGDEKWIITANAGDSRAVLINTNQAIRLSEDHKPDIPSEKKRITNVDGFVFDGRVSNTLAVSRSLGDHHMKKFICSTPYISAVKYSTPDSYLVIACDGIWDVITDDEIYPIIASNGSLADASSISKFIAHEAKKRGSTDNLSVIVVELS